MEISLVRISQSGLYTMRMHLANVVITGGRVAGQAHSLQDEVLGVSIDVVDLCLHSVRTKVLVKEKARIEVVATLWFEVWVTFFEPFRHQTSPRSLAYGRHAQRKPWLAKKARCNK